MDLTIIIVNWNGGEMIASCLESISKTCGPLKLQVIVVDNASRDGSREAAQKKFPQFDIFNSGSNLGFGRANNLVRDRVQSDLVLFLNPDTIVLENSLSEMISFMRSHPEVGGLGCKMRTPDGETHELGLQYSPSPLKEFARQMFPASVISRLFPGMLHRLDPDKNAYAVKLYGGCLLAPKAVLDQIGWFDERYFMYAEDADMCRTILAHGYKLYYLATTEIIHVAGGTTEKAPSGFSILMMSESIAKFMKKYYGSAGSAFYRAGTLVASTFRMAILFLVWATVALTHIKPMAPVRNSLFKHRLLLLWALGLKKPTIAR
jgi:GT2 family glycosyltransferase